MGHRPRVKRGRDANRLLTAIVSTGNGAFSSIYLLGGFNTPLAMRDTQNTEARRPIARTYEGVQWFKHTCPDHNVPIWVAALPGTPLAIVRRPPCALHRFTTCFDDVRHTCFVAVSRKGFDGVRRFYHFDSDALAPSFRLTHAEQTAIWRINKSMPFFTVAKDIDQIRYVRFDDVRHASRVVAELRRALVFLELMA